MMAQGVSWALRLLFLLLNVLRLFDFCVLSILLTSIDTQILPRVSLASRARALIVSTNRRQLDHGHSQHKHGADGEGPGEVGGGA